MTGQIMKKNYNGPVLISSGKDQLWEALIEFPSIQFGVEMAFLSLQSETPFLLFPSEFTEGQNQSKSMVSFGWVKLLLSNK
jgi:cytochrome c-type biogenesis protein CcmE